MELASMEGNGQDNEENIFQIYHKHMMDLQEIDCEFSKENAKIYKEEQERGCRFFCYNCLDPKHGMCSYCYAHCHKNCPQGKRFTDKKSDSKRCACAYLLMHHPKEPEESGPKGPKTDDRVANGVEGTKPEKEYDFNIKTEADLVTFLSYEDSINRYYMNRPDTSNKLLISVGKIFRKNFMCLRQLDFDDFRYGKLKEIWAHRNSIWAALSKKEFATIRGIIEVVFQTPWCSKTLGKNNIIPLFEFAYFGLTYSLFNVNTLKYFIEVIYKLLEERVRYGKDFEKLYYLENDMTGFKYAYKFYLNALGKVLYMALVTYNSFVYEYNAVHPNQKEEYIYEVKEDPTLKSPYGLRVESLIQLLRVINETQSTEVTQLLYHSFLVPKEIKDEAPESYDQFKIPDDDFNKIIKYRNELLNEIYTLYYKDSVPIEGFISFCNEEHWEKYLSNRILKKDKQNKKLLLLHLNRCYLRINAIWKIILKLIKEYHDKIKNQNNKEEFPRFFSVSTGEKEAKSYYVSTNRLEELASLILYTHLDNMIYHILSTFFIPFPEELRKDKDIKDSLKSIGLTIVDLLMVVNMSKKGSKNFSHGKAFYAVSDFLSSYIPEYMFGDILNNAKFYNLQAAFKPQNKGRKKKQKQTKKETFSDCVENFSKEIKKYIEPYLTQGKRPQANDKAIKRINPDKAYELCELILAEMNKLHEKTALCDSEEKEDYDAYNKYVTCMCSSLTFILLALEKRKKASEKYQQFLKDSDSQIKTRSDILQNILRLSYFVYTGRDESLSVQNFQNLTLLYFVLIHQKQLILKLESEKYSIAYDYNYEKNDMIQYYYCNEQTDIKKEENMDPKSLAQKIIIFAVNFEKIYVYLEKYKRWTIKNKKESLFTRSEKTDLLTSDKYAWVYTPTDEISNPDKELVTIKDKNLVAYDKIFNFDFYKGYIFGSEYKSNENYAEFLLKATGGINTENPIKSIILYELMSSDSKFLKILKYSLNYEKVKDDVIQKYVKEVGEELKKSFKKYINLIQLSHNPEEELRLAYNCVCYIKALHSMLEDFNCDFLKYIYDLKEEEKEEGDKKEDKKEEGDVNLVSSKVENSEAKEEEGVNKKICNFMKNEPINYFKFTPAEKANIFEIVLNVFETCASSILIRNARQLETNLEVDDNLFVIYTACIDFLIESLSTPNEDVINLVQEKISQSLANFCKFDLGCYGCLIFPPSKRLTKDIYCKSRLFDLLILIFTSPGCKYFSKLKETPRILKTADKYYFDLLTTYIYIILENYCITRGVIKEEYTLQQRLLEINEAFKYFFVLKDDEIKNKDLLNNIKNFKKEKEGDFKLLEKIFIFISILKDKYGCNGFEEVIKLGKKKESLKNQANSQETGAYDFDTPNPNKFSKPKIVNEAKLIVYKDFKKRTYSIEFNYKLSESLQKN
ncbi:MAG: hypothetical protein MJ252_10485, partial [archaeon]|nr:hypothetical protein [archaeon]